MGGPALIKPHVIPSFLSAEGLEHPAGKGQDDVQWGEDAPVTSRA